MQKILLVGDMEMNCYIIEHNNKCYIVDPGYEKEKIIKYVRDNNLEVIGILLTHGHVDHIGAIDCFDVPVYLYKDEYKVVVDDNKNGFELHGRGKPYNLYNINIIKIDESKEFFIDDKKIQVIHTPGHTIGGVCYKVDNDLYTGDTLFKGTVGKWIFPTGDLETIKKTVISLIEGQEDNVNIHPGHGESSTIKDEKINNKYYCQWKNELKK